MPRSAKASRPEHQQRPRPASGRHTRFLIGVDPALDVRGERAGSAPCADARAELAECGGHVGKAGVRVDVDRDLRARELLSRSVWLR